MFVQEAEDGEVRSICARKDRNGAADITLDGTNGMNRAQREAGADGSGRTTVPLRKHAQWCKTVAVVEEPLWHSPQRVARRLQEIKHGPRISECLAVFSVHTNKVAYQDMGQAWPCRHIIRQSLRKNAVVFICLSKLSCLIPKLLVTSCLTFKHQESSLPCWNTGTVREEQLCVLAQGLSNK